MTLSKEKFEHILAYAKQQQKLGVHHCNILPHDMVAIMEMAAGKLERQERDKQEPVAWRWRQNETKPWHLTVHSDCAGEVQPLYAAPQSFGNSEQLNSPAVPYGWIAEAKRLAELHGLSFVIFRPGEQPRCSDPTKVVISFTDKGLGHQSAEQKQEPNQ